MQKNKLFALRQAICRHAPALLGIALLVGGMLMFIFPFAVVELLPVLLGIIVILFGVYHLRTRRPAFVLGFAGVPGLPGVVQGVVNLAVGAVLVLNRNVSVAFLGVVLGLWALVSGLLSLREAWKCRALPCAGRAIWDGAVKVLLGIFMMVRPFGSMTAWTRLAGLLLIAAGITTLVMLRALRSAFEDLL